MDAGTELAGFWLPGVKASVSVARHFLRAVLAGAGCHAGDVLLVVSELVTNAVKHPRSEMPGGRVWIRLNLIKDGLIGIEVADDGAATLACPRKPVEDSESGRGLRLVDAMSEQWGVRRSGKEQSAVWAQIPVDKEERRAW